MLNSEIKSLPFLHRGKVRDIYEVDRDKLLIVQTDRISAFDVILSEPIPEKGKILTALSSFWFDRLGHVIPNHLTGISPESVVSDGEKGEVEGRAFVVKKLKALSIEAIVRGYIVGSGWKEYKKSGTVCGIPLPQGLVEAEKLPEPIFTPSTKAPMGEHDENISFEEAKRLIGADLAEKVKQAAIGLYSEAAEYALTKGIIIADTKFEFGLDEAGELYLIDEILTPDSSRFWPKDEYRPGRNPPSFDKQYVRDWLETQDWNKQAPAPALPRDVIEKTAEKYREALMRLTSR